VFAWASALTGLTPPGAALLPIVEGLLLGVWWTTCAGRGEDFSSETEGQLSVACHPLTGTLCAATGGKGLSGQVSRRLRCTCTKVSPRTGCRDTSPSGEADIGVATEALADYPQRANPALLPLDAQHRGGAEPPLAGFAGAGVAGGLGALSPSSPTSPATPVAHTLTARFMRRVWSPTWC